MTREQVAFLRNLSEQTIPGSTFRQAIQHIDEAEALLARYQAVVIQPDDAAHDKLWDDAKAFLQ